MGDITLYRPTLSELGFRRKLLADPETMSYNRAWGGVIDFPEEKWAAWYEKWSDKEHFYRYLRTKTGELVGETAYRLDGGRYLCDVIVLARRRGRGYGTQGLELLCAAARANGVKALYDDIAAGNPAVELFLRHGFRVVERGPESILVLKDLLLGSGQDE